MEEFEKSFEAPWSTSVDVYISVSFTKIFDIDTIFQRFNAEAIIESKWHDPNIKSANESLDTNKLWKPDLYIENALDSKDKENEINYRIIQDKDTDQLMVCEIRKVKGLFWECLELQSFPLDVQDLSLTIASKKPGKVVNLIIMNHGVQKLKINNTLDKSMWLMHNIVISRKDKIKREFSYGKRTFPAVKVTAQAFRLPGFFYWNAVLPILLVTCASLCPFVVDCKLPQNRLPATATMLLTSVSMRWIIGRLLPTVSYLTSLDKYSLASIVIIVMELIYHATMGALFPLLPPVFAYRVDKVVFVLFVSLLICKQIIFVVWVIRVSKERKRIKKNEIVKTNDEPDSESDMEKVENESEQQMSTRKSKKRSKKDRKSYNNNKNSYEEVRTDDRYMNNATSV